MNSLGKGSRILLEIRKMGINGEGIGYYNKLAVFVPGAIEKEVVYAVVDETYDKYSVAHIESFIRKSTKRVEPFCKFYDDCGACTMQHIDSKEQLKIKRELVINALRKYANLNVDNIRIEKTVASDEINYRNKSQLPFRETNFGLALGLFAANTNKFVYIDECAIQNDLVNMINKKVLTILLKYKQTTVKEGGVLKYLVVRGLEDSNEASVTFVLSEYKPIFKTIAEELYENNSEIKNVAYTVQKPRSVEIFGDTVETLAGNNYIKDNMLGLEIKLSPKAFYQLNKKQSEKLYKEIVDSGIKETDVIFDAYSGVGILGMLCAKKAKHVYSADLNSDSIKNARIMARQNSISNITFFSDRIENRLPILFEEGKDPNVVILDPPRSGLDKAVIKALINSNVEKIFYISCNPSTLAKNISELSQRYEIEYIRPYDFFTETAHVESMALLTLKK